MWICPKCGREFARENQDHYCGQPPRTIDEYIEAQPASVRPLLADVRATIKAVLPDAEERISWRMPTFWQGHNIIHFAAFGRHIGLYPGAEAMEYFRDRLVDYKTSKGAVQFSFDKGLPLSLIAEIAVWCLATGHNH